MITARRWWGGGTWRVTVGLLCLTVMNTACQPQVAVPPVRTAGPTLPVDLTIRVRLEHHAPEVRLAVESGYTLLDGHGEILTISSGVLAPTLARSSLGEAPMLTFGDEPMTARTIEIRPSVDGSLVVGDRHYRGRLRVTATKWGVATTNLVHVEPYLKGVLHGEMPASFAREALRAQAIVARTYALYQKLALSRHRQYDVLAGEGSQVYLGADGESAKAIDAVDYTRGIVLTWDGPDGAEIFSTYFSSTCGGCSQSVANVKPEPEIPPLAGGVKCDFCREATYYRWPPVRLSRDTVTERLRKRFYDLASIQTIVSIEPVATTPEGRVIRVAMTDAAGRRFERRGEDFRLAMGSRDLKSTWFVVRAEGDGFVFEQGRGFGHGMGMCQHGANGMARVGATAGQILRFYYPHSDLAKAYE